MREWEQIIPEEERKIYEKAGYKGKDSFGRNPALLVIDAQNYMVGERGSGRGEWPYSCGEAGWHTPGVYADSRAGGVTVAAGAGCGCGGGAYIPGAVDGER